MKIIFLGIFVAIFGFAFAFTGMRASYGNLFYMFPNLLSGFVIGIGGIVISIIGGFLRIRRK